MATIAQRANGKVAQSTGSTSSATTSAFNTQADDIVLIFVCIVTTTSTVSSITDLIGNSYYQVPGGSINNSTNVRIELWATTSIGSNSNNTITVQLSAGSKFVAVAESYSGASALGVVSTSTSSSANPSQALTIRQNGGWVVAGFAGQNTGTFTISTGNDRGNTVTAGGSPASNVGGALGDNTTGGAPGSISVAYTNTDTIWALSIVELTVSTEPSWFPDPVYSYNKNTVPARTYSRAEPFVSQVRPTLATLPSQSSYISPPASPSVIWKQKFARPELIRQERPTLATLPSQSSYLTQPAVPSIIWKLTYNKPEPFVSQVRFIIPTFPTGIMRMESSGMGLSKKTHYISYLKNPIPLNVPSTAFDLSRTPPSKVVLRYAPSDYASPPKFNLFITTIFLSWYVPDIYRVQTKSYVSSSFDNQVFPTLVLFTAPSRSNIGSGSRGAPVPQHNSPSVRPYVFATAAITTLSWMLQIERKIFTLSYAKTEFVNQIFPTLATLPVFVSELTKIASNSVTYKYASSDYAAPPKFFVTTQLSVYAWLPSDVNRSLTQRYTISDFVNQVFPTLVLFTAPSRSNIGSGSRGSQVPKHLVSSVKPIFVTVPIPIGTAAGLDIQSRPRNYSPFSQGDTFTAPPKFGLVAVVTPTINSWYPTIGVNKVSLIYPKIEDAQLHGFSGPTFEPDFGWYSYNTDVAKVLDINNACYLISPEKSNIPVTIVLSWQPLDARRSLPSVYRYSDYSNQVRPTLATLPALMFGIAEIAPNALPKNYAPSAWDAPPKFGLTISSTITIANWLATLGQNAVVLKYALSDYSSPAKFGLVQAAQTFLPGWASTVGVNSVVLKYATTDYVNQIRPTLATLPVFIYSEILNKIQTTNYSLAENVFALRTIVTQTVLGFFIDTSNKNLTQNYQKVEDAQLHVFTGSIFKPNLGWYQYNFDVAKTLKYSYDAHVKYDLTSIVTPSLAGWSSIIGQNAVVLKYAIVDYSSPVRFDLVVAAPTISSWYPTTGQNAVVLKYAISDYSSPAKFGLVVVATPTVSSWSSTLGQNAVTLKYAISDYSAPAKFGLVVVATPTIASWYPTIGQNAVVNVFAKSDYVSPPKFGLVVVVTPTISSWSSSPVSGVKLPNRYSIIEDAQLHGFVGPVFEPDFGWPSTVGQNALDLTYSPGSYVSPDKTTPSVTLTINNWFATEGKNAVTLKYAISDYSAPAKFGLIVVATPTISSWTPTAGQSSVVTPKAPTDYVNQIYPTLVTLPSGASFIAYVPPAAQPQRYTSTVWDAPPKFGIITPAPITLSNWTPTTGQNAVILKYALPDYVTQVRPTLFTLPSGTSFLAYIPPNAQPQKFAPVDFVNQIRPTLTPLPTGIATDFTVFGRRANPPTFAPGDIFTGPPVFGLGFIAGSIFKGEVVFYKVIARNTTITKTVIGQIVVNGRVVKIVLVE